MFETSEPVLVLTSTKAYCGAVLRATKIKLINVSHYEEDKQFPYLFLTET